MKNLVAAFLLSLAVAALPAVSAGPVAGPEGRCAATDARLITAAGFAEEDVGYLVVDLADKRVVAEHNPDRPFLPASVAKIPTIAAALAILGGDHRFVTTLHAVGEVRDGVLTGSLTLRGGGDPFLSSEDLQAMAKALAASGIKRVDGHVPVRRQRAGRGAPDQRPAARGGRLQHRRQRAFGQLQPRAPQLDEGRCPILPPRLPPSART